MSTANDPCIERDKGVDDELVPQNKISMVMVWFSKKRLYKIISFARGGNVL